MEVIHSRVAGARSERREGTFTGEVWVDPVMGTTDGVTINDVFFTPGSRTFWHHHEAGQILPVSSGYGIVCAAGGKPQVLKAGTTVWTPPGEQHWHGGGAVCCMQHMAISLGQTRWLDPVSDDDYARAQDVLS